MSDPVKVLLDRLHRTERAHLTCCALGEPSGRPRGLS